MARLGGIDRGLYSQKNAEGKPRWYVRIAIHGAMQRFGQPDGFLTKEDARTFRDRMRVAVRERRYFPGSHMTEATIPELTQSYLDSIEGKRASYRDKKRHLDWWGERFEKRLILSLDPLDIERGLTALRKQGCSPSTANRYAESLRSMMRKLVSPPSWVFDLWQKVELFDEDERVMPTYSPAQLELLFARLDRDDALLVYLDLLVGIRQSLFFAQRWEWLLWTHGAMQYPSFKRQKAFTLPLSGEALAILTVLHEEQGRPATGWIFPAKIQNSTRYNFAVHRDAHNWYTRIFKPVLIELNMETLTFHALRRTWATALGSSAPQRILQLLGNWSDGKVTERYCRPHDASLREAMDSVAASFGTARKLPATKTRQSKTLRNLLKKRVRPRSSVG
jgi:integrase